MLLPASRRELRPEAGRPLPEYVEAEFDAYLKCGRLEEGFLRLRCEQCHAEKLVAFSCKKRGFCPSCGARRMAETAALLADEILPEQPLRQWVLSLPMALRFLLATRPAVLSAVLGVVYRTISGHLLREARLTRRNGLTGAVTLIQRFGSALNLNVHLHMIFVDGAYRSDGTAPPVFHPVPPPRRHLTRYHGIFAPHSTLRAAITPAGRGRGAAGGGAKPDAEAAAVPKHVAMSWAQRLKQVFAIEIEACAR